MYNTWGRNKQKWVKKFNTFIFFHIFRKCPKIGGIEFFDPFLFISTPSVIHFWNQWFFSEFLVISKIEFFSDFIKSIAKLKMVNLPKKITSESKMEEKKTFLKFDFT